MRSRAHLQDANVLLSHYQKESGACFWHNNFKFVVTVLSHTVPPRFQEPAPLIRTESSVLLLTVSIQKCTELFKPDV